MTGKQEVKGARPARNTWSGVLFGLGLMALADEIIFHQLLQWHHFYDRSTPFIGIMSDGLLNAFALFALIAGLFWLAGTSRGSLYQMGWWKAAFYRRVEGFQVSNGIGGNRLYRFIRYVMGWIIFCFMIWHGIFSVSFLSLSAPCCLSRREIA